MTPDTTTPPAKEALKVCLTDGAGSAMLAVLATNIGCDVTTRTKLVQVPQIRLPDALYPAARGASVCGRIPSVSLKKAVCVGEVSLHFIGRFDGRRQSKPGKWTRWGLVGSARKAEPIRTEAMSGLAP